MSKWGLEDCQKQAAESGWTRELIIKANEEAGHYFFSPGTMRCFGSRVSEFVAEGPGGVWFVTSEKEPGMPRRYRARRFDPATGHVLPAGNWAPTSAAAKRTAADMARHWALEAGK